ncbi:sigma-70 family RNA polymerase sigma factor [Corynebacterium glyciniphilum]|uniref:sigma-70 family RNA polymerase sigma factor n=1 Tax=Corynebacterium glyciniphilum TaxID=1404244 RepID=UPI003FD5A8E3
MTRSSALETTAETYRAELIVYCYRFFGCHAEAEDAVQETLIRVWRSGEGFEGRSSLRRWLYAIATNVCLDMSRSRQRRSLPVDLSDPGTVPTNPDSLPTAAEVTWVGPIATTNLADDPADAAVRRETVRLAFIAALQYLPPRQRVVLILRDVLAWRASECAELLEVSVASVNSALARARATLRTRVPTEPESGTPFDEALLCRYVSAFEAFDVDALVGLLAEDAAFTMPPFTLWLRGRRSIEQWWSGPGQVCRNSRTIRTSVNGQPAVAVYHSTSGELWAPFAVHVLDVRDGRITGLTHFMGSGVFAELGLPESLPESFPAPDR